jgi:hypothetical protein
MRETLARRRIKATISRPGSIAPLRYQPAALVRRYVEFFDRGLDRRFLIRLVVNSADKLGRRALEVVDGPRMVRLFGRSLAIAGLR